jgi:hypothetical protein
MSLCCEEAERHWLSLVNVFVSVHRSEHNAAGKEKIKFQVFTFEYQRYVLDLALFAQLYLFSWISLIVLRQRIMIAALALLRDPSSVREKKTVFNDYFEVLC